MDFLEDLEMYDKAMSNAYDIITKKKTVNDIYLNLEDEDHDIYYLPFDPIEEDGRSPDIIDMVIEYYTSTEEYEKCAELAKIKEECLKTSTD